MIRFINILTFAVILSLIMSFDRSEQESGRRDAGRREKAFEVYTKDSIRLDIELVYNEQDIPDHYFSHVRTPVCEDGLCELLVIDLYWDLLGNFKAYQTPPGLPMTKFDHEAFTEEDHQKLQKILADKRSLLGENQLEDLIDENTKLVSEQVDAVTGATKKSVEKAVVSGAMYSTYVLWYIVNGEIADRIPDYTHSIWNEDLLRRFLKSENYHYQYYALDQLSEARYDKYMPEILEMIEGESVFVSLYTINHLPQRQLEKEKWQLALAKEYLNLSYRCQNKLLEKFEEVELRGESMEILAGSMDKMNENQLESILNLMQENKESLTDETISKLTGLLNHDNPIYAEKGYQAMKAMELKNKAARKAIKNYEKN